MQPDKLRVLEGEVRGLQACLRCVALVLPTQSRGELRRMMELALTDNTIRMDAHAKGVVVAFFRDLEAGERVYAASSCRRRRKRSA